MKAVYSGGERRQFVRLPHSAPLNYKVCSKDAVSKLLDGYTSNVSETGLLCRIKEKVDKDDLIWLCFDRSVLDFCQQIDKRALIYQNGVIGKVVRVEHKLGHYDVGVQFVTREEKNLTHIYPKVYFFQKHAKQKKNG